MDGWGVAAIIALMFASFVIGVVIVARRGVTVNVTQANNNSAGAGAPAGQRTGGGFDGFRLMVKAIGLLALVALAVMVISKADAMLNPAEAPATVQAPAEVPAEVPAAVPTALPVEAPAAPDYVLPIVAGVAAGLLMLVGYAVVHRVQRSDTDQPVLRLSNDNESYYSRLAESYADFDSMRATDNAERRHLEWRARQHRREMQAIRAIKDEQPIPIESVSLFDEARRNRS